MIYSIDKEKNEELRLRIIEALDYLKIPQRGRVAKVAAKTSYSQGAISGFFSGKTLINDRFFQIFWRNFEINPEWLHSGKGEISYTHALEARYPYLEARIPTEEDFDNWESNLVIKEAIRELSKMSDSKLWRAVAMLKEMNEETEGKKRD